jgi:hypothetical protein
MIYLDNNDFRQLEGFYNGNIKEKQLMSSSASYKIDVNSNYLNEFKLENLLPSNSSLYDINVLVPNELLNDVKKDKKQYCSYPRKYRLPDGVAGKCNIIGYDNKNVFVNAIANKDGSPYYKKAIIRVISDRLLKNDFYIPEDYLFLKLDNNKTLNENYSVLLRKE